MDSEALAPRGEASQLVSQLGKFDTELKRTYPAQAFWERLKWFLVVMGTGKKAKDNSMVEEFYAPDLWDDPLV